MNLEKASQILKETRLEETLKTINTEQKMEETISHPEYGQEQDLAIDKIINGSNLKKSPKLSLKLQK